MDILRETTVITRKKHRCNGCGRLFPKGSKMHIQVNVQDGINTFKTCPTCQELLTKHREYFEEDGICYTDCVIESLDVGQTPEMLLELLNTKIL
jgi:predicted  nucleic acid-binding Zn-ribbon protein